MIIEAALVLVCLLGAGYWLAVEITIRRYQRHRLLGHPAEEAAITRAFARLNGTEA